MTKTTSAGTGRNSTPVPTPDFVSAITAEVQPIKETDQAYVDLVTIVNLPYSVQLVNVETLSGNKPPVNWTVDSYSTSCPSVFVGRPNDQACRQHFRIYYSFDTCQFLNQNSNAHFKVLGGAPKAEVVLNFQDNSNNSCSEHTVSVAKPVIASLAPTTATHGIAFELVVNGRNFLVGEPAISIGPYNFTPTTVTDSQLRLTIPATMFASYSGPINIAVITAGGTSNAVALTIQ